MTGQTSLFDAPATRPYLSARRTDPPESVEAAKQLTGRLDRAVWVHYRVTGRTMTPDVVAQELGLHPPSVVSAISRLVRDEFLVRVGDGTSARGYPCGEYKTKED